MKDNEKVASIDASSNKRLKEVTCLREKRLMI
jgi:hypothetical protein